MVTLSMISYKRYLQRLAYHLMLHEARLRLLKTLLYLIAPKLKARRRLIHSSLPPPAVRHSPQPSSLHLHIVLFKRMVARTARWSEGSVEQVAGGF